MVNNRSILVRYVETEFSNGGEMVSSSKRVRYTGSYDRYPDIQPFHRGNGQSPGARSKSIMQCLFIRAFRLVPPVRITKVILIGHYWKGK